MRNGPLVVVGDTLLDRDLAGRADRVSPDAPVPVVCDLAETARPGGAGLAALLAAADGRPVVLVTALAADAGGQRLRWLLAEAGVTVRAVPLPGRTPEKVRIRAGGQSLLRLDWADRRHLGVEVPEEMAAELSAAVREAGAVLASDYGRGMLGAEPVRGWLAAAAGSVPVVWDPHPRGREPVPGVLLATPNLAEAVATAGTGAPDPGAAGTGGLGEDEGAGGRADGRGFSAGTAGGWADGRGGDEGAGSVVAVAARVGRVLLQRWQARSVAVTLGARGALLATPDDVPLAVPAPAARAADPCGAGDRFAATAAGALGDGALLSEAVTAAVGAATDYVAAGGPASIRPGGRPDPTRLSTVEDVLRRTRAAGGTVVATGGCFDLLHAGHVRTLEAARRLGDCLLVFVNSDASVRRLKGPRRPVVPARDRARVLAALGCVDAVAVFDEDTPLAVLDRVRPDIWVKGGDYSAAALPETELLRRWGGEVVVVPYLDGRSTTRLVAAAAETTRPDANLMRPV